MTLGQGQPRMMIGISRLHSERFNSVQVPYIIVDAANKPRRAQSDVRSSAPALRDCLTRFDCGTLETAHILPPLPLLRLTLSLLPVSHTLGRIHGPSAIHLAPPSHCVTAYRCIMTFVPRKRGRPHGARLRDGGGAVGPGTAMSCPPSHGTASLLDPVPRHRA